MPQLPRAHASHVVASGLLIEALFLAASTMRRAPVVYSIPVQQTINDFLLWSYPVGLAISGVGIFARRAWAWWLGLILVLLMLLSTPGQLLVVFRLAAPGLTADLFEPAERTGILMGWVLLACARAGWHLMLALGLVRLDVRVRLGVHEWSPARAIAAAASTGAGFVLLMIATRLGLGL